MAISARFTIAGSPEFHLRAKTGPIAFELEGEGAVELRTGAIRAEIGEIPISMRVPFLKRHHGRVLVASVGPFGIKLEPLELQLRALGAQIAGVVGPEGLDCALEGKVSCKMEVDVTGKIPRKFIEDAIEGALE
jgi:hypothetical protein